jgi:uncharacterized RDD family membrane protein YckC
MERIILDNNEQQINVENLQLASSKKRIRAFVIDDLAITFIVIVMMWDTIAQTNGDFASILIIINNAFIQVLMLKFIYQTLFIWYYGATLGKMITNIKVIDFDNFGRIKLINSMLRSMGRIFSEMIFYIGFFIGFYTESKQTLHDKMGRTLVVDA